MEVDHPQLAGPRLQVEGLAVMKMKSGFWIQKRSPISQGPGVMTGL